MISDANHEPKLSEKSVLDTALLLTDVQTGVDELNHWGRANGGRNNQQAEEKIALLLNARRDCNYTVFATRYDSR
jgi:hypothetical protein